MGDGRWRRDESEGDARDERGERASYVMIAEAVSRLLQTPLAVLLFKHGVGRVLLLPSEAINSY